MFCQEEYVIRYPSKSIVVDILSRDGVADEFSFSPYTGRMSEYIRKDILADPAFRFDDILSTRKDFSTSKALGAMDEEDAVDDVGVELTNETFIKLRAEVDQAVVDKYARSVLNYYLTDNESPFKKRVYDNKARDLLVGNKNDSQTETDETDLIVRNGEKWDADVVEAASALPFYLRMLHQGNGYYEGHLLSFIIAYETVKSGNLSDTPKNILASSGCICYRCNKESKVIGRFSDKDNNSQRVRTLLSWVRGEYPDDVYYKMYKHLMEAVTVLNINIIEEKPLMYLDDVMEKAVCTFLCTNEEYVEDFGMVDKRLLSELSPESLFSISKSFSMDSTGQDLTKVIKEDDKESTLLKFYAYINIKFNDDDKDVRYKVKHRFLDKKDYEGLDAFLHLYGVSINDYEESNKGMLLTRSNNVAFVGDAKLFDSRDSVKVVVMMHRSGTLLASYNISDSVFYSIDVRDALEKLRRNEKIHISDWDENYLQS